MRIRQFNIALLFFLFLQFANVQQGEKLRMRYDKLQVFGTSLSLLETNPRRPRFLAILLTKKSSLTKAHSGQAALHAMIIRML